MKKRYLCLLLASFVLVGSACTTLKVRRFELDGAVAPKGVPFYVKTGACKQESVYLETVLVVSLREIEGDKTVQTSEWTLPDKAKSVVRGVELKLTGPTPLSYNQAAEILELIPTYDPMARSGYLASNGVAQISFVDYSHGFTANGRRPWIGSASTAFELAGDGTLTKVSAEVEDSTVSTLLETLPITSFLESILIPEEKSADPQAVDTPGKKAVLTMETIVFKHTLSKVHGAESPCADRTAIDLADSAAAYTRTRVQKSDSAKKDDSNSIQVSGTIALPKPKAGDK